MPENNNGLSLHAEDVIFNKPSLKELIRLIKNGSINAIWPSTLEEFTDWNNGGYLKYAPKGQRLKSQKTAMTVFYGDNEDTIAGNDINKQKTMVKYNNIVDSINALKNEVVELKYYDDIKDIYPTNLTLAKILNIDDINNHLTDSGYIKNSEEIINYKTEILSNYNNLIVTLQDFIERIKTFEPKIDRVDSVLEDANIENDYNLFFTNSSNELNNLLASIPVPIANIDDDINKNLIKDNLYYFDKIINLYETKILLINTVLDYIKKYYDNTEQKLIFDSYYFDKIKDIEETYDDYIENLHSLINNQFFEKIVLTTDSNCYIAQSIQMPYIFFNAITEDKKLLYNNNIEELLKDYIYPFKNCIKYFYIINNHGNATIEEAEEYYQTIINNINMYMQVMQTEDLNVKIDYINQTFIKEINSYIQNVQKYEGFYFEINITKDGLLDNYELLLNKLNESYNLINALESVMSEYQTYIAANFLPRTQIDLNSFYTLKTNIIDLIDDKVKIKEGDILNSIQQDQNNVKQYYTNAFSSYVDFINQLKNLNINYVQPLAFDIGENQIMNLNEILTSINEQLTLITDHVNALTSKNTFNAVLTDPLKELSNTAYNLQSTIINAKIIIKKVPNSDYFNSFVIAPTGKPEYTFETIQVLYKKLSGSSNKIQITIENTIPVLSEDLLYIKNYDAVISILENIQKISGERKDTLEDKISQINNYIETWYPDYEITNYSHYTCIAVGSDIVFPKEITEYKDDNGNQIKYEDRSKKIPDDQIDGTVTIKVDDEFHYPKINGYINEITTSTRNSELLTVGGLISLFNNSDSSKGITSQQVGNHYTPIHILNGKFTACNNIISGSYITQPKGETTYWDVRRDNGTTDGEQVGLQAKKLFGAVYNDYAEYRSADAQAGRCIIENGDGTLSLSTGRLQLGANIVSDTYGFAIGETNDATCPIAVCGRVLAYPLESKEMYHPGAAVCSGPNGTISIMTREEIREWPDTIVGYVSEIPTYDTWGSDNVPVNGRIWIKIK